jgi:hypothetical protein
MADLFRASLNDYVSASVYFQQRLHTAARATQLPASAQFDLAHSDVPDNQLEQIVAQFGGTDQQSWGISDVFHQMLSRDPQKVTTKDLSTLQTNLKTQGFAPPDMPVDGQWTPSWQAAFRSWDHNNLEAQLGGEKGGRFPTAAPVSAGVRLISNTMPSNVFQTLVGAAKGFVEEAPQVATHLGLAGGAAAGAGIGAAAGIAGGPFAEVTVPVGAAVGAVVGGVTGLLSSLFGHEETKQPGPVLGWSNIVDALSPYTEYHSPGGANKFFEDLGWVGTAASLVGAAGIGAEGIQAGLEASGEGLMTKTPAQAGWMSKILAGAVKPFSSDASSGLLDWFKTNGMLAQQTRPLFQIARGAYTGLSTAAIGAKYAGGFGEGTFTTPIEKAIAQAPKLPDAVNLLSFIMMPTQIFPFKLGQIGSAVTDALGDTSMMPWAHTYQTQVKAATGHTPSLGDATDAVRSFFGADPYEAALAHTWTLRNFAIDARASIDANKMGGDVLGDQGYLIKAKSAIIAQLHAGIESGDQSFAGELLNFGKDTSNQPALETWIGRHVDLTNPDGLSNYLKAERMVQDATAAIQRGDVQAGGIGGMVTHPAEFQQVASVQKIRELEAQATQLSKQAADLAGSDPGRAVELKTAALSARAEAEKVRTEMPKVTKIKRTAGNVVLTAARLDTPTSGDLIDLSKKYDQLRDAVLEAKKATARVQAATSSELGLQNISAVEMQARSELAQFVQGEAFKGTIPDQLVANAMGEMPGKKVSSFLARKAEVTASDITLPDEQMQTLKDLGFKPVTTSGDVVFTSDMVKMGELQGLGDLTRRAAFFETIGGNPHIISNEDLGSLRRSHVKASLGQAMAESGVQLSGEQALRRLDDKLMETEQNSGLFKGGVHRLRPVDFRDLTLSDIEATYQGTPGFDDQVARKVFYAVRRGSALGGEADLLHPLDTMREIGRAVRVQGLPGFADTIRTFNVPALNDPKKLVALSAVAGAGVGYGTGKNLKSAVIGGIGGGLIGAGYSALAKGMYGYLPDKLARLTTALRYTLSPLFDAQRYAKNGLIGAMKYDLPISFSPKKDIIDAFTPEGWKEAGALWDRLNGSNYAQSFEDLDRFATQTGLLLYNPKNYEMRNAYLLAQRGWSESRIKEAVSAVSRYGLGRTGIERSANFVFFPFSFEKKFLTTLGDFILQGPGRALLVHEAVKRYYESGLSEKMHTYLEDHAPLLDDLSKLNGLSHGISPGGFFLQGLDDNQTNVGKVAEILAHTLVPGGSVASFGRTAGELGDLAAHAFVPVVGTGDTIRRAGGMDGVLAILNDYVPVVRDLINMGHDLREELNVIKSPHHETSFAQEADMLDQLRQFKDQLDPVAQSLGYSDADGLMQSSTGASLAASYKELQMKLADQFPDGYTQLQNSTNNTALDAKALYDMANKPSRTRAEDIILQMKSEEDQMTLLAKTLNLSPQMANSMLTDRIRTIALQHVNDPQFASLYARFFGYQYGPIQLTA